MEDETVDHLENEVFTKLLQKYVEVLQDNSLQPAERAKFEKMRDDLSDALLQNWLPPDPSRRKVLKAIAFSGMFGLFTDPKVSPGRGTGHQKLPPRPR